MNPVGCKSLEPFLNAFVDGELGGAEMLRVSQHLEACNECAQEVEGLRGIGGLLRRAAADEAALSNGDARLGPAEHDPAFDDAVIADRARAAARLLKDAAPLRSLRSPPPCKSPRPSETAS